MYFCLYRYRFIEYDCLIVRNNYLDDITVRAYEYKLTVRLYCAVQSKGYSKFQSSSFTFSVWVTTTCQYPTYCKPTLYCTIHEVEVETWNLVLRNIELHAIA